MNWNSIDLLYQREKLLKVNIREDGLEMIENILLKMLIIEEIIMISNIIIKIF